MRQFCLSISLLLAAVILVGCGDKKKETEEVAPVKVTARFYHIARIGNQAEMWKDDEKEESVELPEDLELVGNLEAAPVSRAVGEDAEFDISAIVESAARESASPEGIRKAVEKEKEKEKESEEKPLGEEAPKYDLEMNEGANNNSAENEVLGDDSLEINIPMGNENDFPLDEDDGSVSEDDDSTAEETGTDINVNEEAEEEAEQSEENPVKDAEPEAKKPVESKSNATKKEVEDVERQAEAFLKVLRNTPKEVSDEFKNANFQNVTYRLVKIPAAFQENADEYLVLRTMEYTGTNLESDFQILSHSPHYSAWVKEQEKCLDLDVDSKYWVEAAEFWSADQKEK